jgi:phosphoribosylamine---glycine ligase
MMKVLVIGSGGREHAIVWKLMQSPQISALYCAPGNSGISQIATCIPFNATDVEGVVGFCRKEGIGFVVVGPENALSAGIVDECEKVGILAFGPKKAGAQIETSKVFSKNLMNLAGIPTAPFQIFTDYNVAKNYLSTIVAPFVIKADGLCAGKGAFVVDDAKEGDSVLKDLLIHRIYGEAGSKVIVEGFLPGVEVSYLAFADGKTVLPMVPSQDHKTLLDGDEGPNTGGMGAYAPVPFIDKTISDMVDRKIMAKTITTMNAAGIPYKGVLYAGLMMDGLNPSVLEFNARFGDPETQPILYKMKSDLLPVLVACAQGNLSNVEPIEWNAGVALCVVIASKGYPDRPETGFQIHGLEELSGRNDIIVFHAGTKTVNNRIYTSGGRVLGVTVIGEDFSQAITKAYSAIECIHFEGMQFRRDIGKKALRILSC